MLSGPSCDISCLQILNHSMILGLLIAGVFTRQLCPAIKMQTHPSMVRTSAELPSVFKLENNCCRIYKRMSDGNLLKRMIHGKHKISTNDNAATKANPSGDSTAATSDKHWTPTNATELQVYIAINTIMGLNDESEYADYWSIEPVLNVPLVSAMMPRRRYEKLSQYVHVSINANADRMDKLTKVHPFIELCQQNYAAVYSSSRDMAVDEVMIEFDGRIGWKQYMPKKPVNWGIKL